MSENNNPKVPRIRACSFVPDDHMIPITYDNGETQLYLEVKWRQHWFHTFCEENGISGYIDDSDVEIRTDIGTGGFVRSTATVYMDGCVVGKSSAGCPIINMAEGNNLRTVIQNACTVAKGRALANAGFGTIASREPTDGAEFPCDSGYSVGGDGTIRFNVANPAAPEEKTKRSRKKSAAANPTTGSNSTAQANANDLSFADVGPVPTFTVEQAQQYIVPIGAMKGRTLGETIATRRKDVEWYASPEFQNGRYPELKTAAQTLLNAGL